MAPAHIAHGSVLVYSVQPFQELGVEAFASHAHEVALRVPGAIPRRHDGVLSLEDDLAMGVHEHCAEGMIALLAGLPGQLDGCEQVALILTGHAAIQHVVPVTAGASRLIHVCGCALAGIVLTMRLTSNPSL